MLREMKSEWEATKILSKKNKTNRNNKRMRDR